jgi:hypothetical protein
MKNQPTSELFDNLAHNSIQITLQALAEKDQIIKELKQKLVNCNCQQPEKETQNA